MKEKARCAGKEGIANRRRRVLPVLMALVMVLTMGLLPGGESSASGPAYKGAVKPATYVKGDYVTFNCIDISAWQGKRSVSQFKAMMADGVTHVILRSSFTYGSKTKLTMEGDSVFKNNIVNAYKAGMKIGVYHFSQAKTPDEAAKEANFTLKQIAQYKSMITLPVVFDWEFHKRLTSSYAKGKGKSYCTSICNRFCNTVKNAGYEPVVYANLSTMNNYLNANIYQSWKIWLAQYSRSCGYRYPMYMWQYSSSGKISGLSGKIDVNYLFAPISRVKQSNGTYKFKCYDVKKGRYLTDQWVSLKGKTYRLDGNGRTLIGYRQVGSYHYGFASDGAMYANTTATIKGKTYKFAKNGRSVLYKAKTTKKLVYRASKSTFSKKKGKYKKGKTISVVLESGSWVQASNGYWSKKKYLKKTTVYPQ